ncbi:hypothetical protein Mycsm_01622 [Mycobacterium sp. JS623]|nr:hypothetical protein Mycsm_01622 [Mycobacterium sp. JS623]
MTTARKTAYDLRGGSPTTSPLLMEIRHAKWNPTKPFHTKEST